MHSAFLSSTCGSQVKDKTLSCSPSASLNSSNNIWTLLKVFQPLIAATTLILNSMGRLNSLLRFMWSLSWNMVSQTHKLYQVSIRFYKTTSNMFDCTLEQHTAAPKKQQRSFTLVSPHLHTFTSDLASSLN
jgi:hypothetical protein